MDCTGHISGSRGFKKNRYNMPSPKKGRVIIKGLLLSLSITKWEMGKIVFKLRKFWYLKNLPKISEHSRTCSVSFFSNGLPPAQGFICSDLTAHLVWQGFQGFVSASFFCSAWILFLGQISSSYLTGFPSPDLTGILSEGFILLTRFWVSSSILKGYAL